MKIALLTSDSREVIRRYSDPEPSFGTAPEALLQGLAGLPGCETHVVSCVQQPVRSPEKIAGNIYYHAVVVPKIGWMRTSYQGCIRATRKKLRELQPDMVHGQGTERDCAISAVFSGFPNVLTVHGNMRLISKINKARPLSFEWLAARLEGFTLPRSDGVVCITTYTQRAVAPLARQTWLLPNAVDSAFFALEPQPATPREIVCVANISPRKNQVKLIQALQPLAAKENFQLVFYGGAARTDPYATEFFRQLEANPWCRFEGMVDRPKLRAALVRSAMLVLPSLEDNCPMTVLEAMAAGVPVAAANVGGVPELVTDKVDGILFDPTNDESIREGVANVLLREKDSRRLAAAAKKRALEQYHPSRIAARHLEIYEEVIRQRRK